MNKGKLNYWIDFGLLISFLIVTLTGIIKFRGLGLYSVLGFSGISTWHDWSGIVMAVLVLVHLVLHWNWIVCETKNIFSKKEVCEEET
jgi:hypothetical protein